MEWIESNIKPNPSSLLVVKCVMENALNGNQFETVKLAKYFKGKFILDDGTDYSLVNVIGYIVVPE